MLFMKPFSMCETLINSVYCINKRLNTLHVNFTIPGYILWCWYRTVQKPCKDFSISAYTIAVHIRFLDSLRKKLCQMLVFHAINTIVTVNEGNIRIDRLPLGRVLVRTFKLIFSSPSARTISFPLVRTTNLGLSSGLQKAAGRKRYRWTSNQRDNKSFFLQFEIIVINFHLM